MKKLIILRHAHAKDLQEGFTHDFYRTLSKKGELQAQEVGENLKKLGLNPDYIISSTAPRAYQTVIKVADTLGLDYQKISTHSECYRSSLSTWKDIIGYYDQCDLVLICGHNPELLSLCKHFDPSTKELKKGEFYIFNPGTGLTK